MLEQLPRNKTELDARFTELYRAHLRDVYSYSYYRVGNHHDTEDLVEGRDELARIIEAIKELPEERREALIMRFALGMDNREIARAMGKTDGATKVLLHRAIKQLEGMVAENAGGAKEAS